MAAPCKPAAPSTSAAALESVYFYCGNPLTEETRGIAVLHPDSPADSSSSDLPAGRKPLVCVLAVPYQMTYTDFCLFCDVFVPKTLEMRIVRIDGIEDGYSVFIKFDTQDTTDCFYKQFNGKKFTLLEEYSCHIRFVQDEPYLTSLAERAPCPICHKQLDQDPGGILITMCNHSFHCSCLPEWADSSCPVCRCCQQQTKKPICSVCGTYEDIWICVLCGHAGCGRYKGGHAIKHWKEAEHHSYALELETRKVWDYAEDDYVHRLIQSRTYRKPIEYNCHGDHTKDSMCSICGGDSATNEDTLNRSVEDAVKEYNSFLASHLELQKQYLESHALKSKEEYEKEKSATTEKDKLMGIRKLQAKLDKCTKDVLALDEMNGNLIKNLDTMQDEQARGEDAIKMKDEEIKKLEDELRDLKAQSESQGAVAQAPVFISSDTQGGTIPASSSSTISSNSTGDTRGRKKKRK